MIGCLPTQSLAFLAVFIYATHATQAIAFGWKPGFSGTSTYGLNCLGKGDEPLEYNALFTFTFTVRRRFEDVTLKTCDTDIDSSIV